MSIVVVGSVAYDSVKTSHGSREDSLGGSATYFSIAASYFDSVQMVAVVGEDFARSDIDLLESHDVDVSGLEIANGKTFRWAGEYGIEDVNTRWTLDTRLNVFSDFSPQLGPQHRTAPFLFLGNIQPELQLNVLEQMDERPRLIGVDTMNFWIDGDTREPLTEVIKKVDVVFMDEGEARMFAAPHVKTLNVVRAARYMLGLGPKLVVIKRGEHGVIQFTEDSVFAAPAFPLDDVVDPTGAGDSFAGGFMGYLAAAGEVNAGQFRRAAAVGSVMGSFAVQSFSVDRLSSLDRKDIAERFRSISDLSHFNGNDALPLR